MGKSQEGDVHPLGFFIKRHSAARQTAWAAPVSRVEKNPDKQYTV